MEQVKRPDFRDPDAQEYCCAIPVYEEKRQKETGDDFILPDYLPDVGKIAAVFPQVTLKSRSVGDGTLEYEGEVCYTLLYAAEDGSVRSALFLSGFEDKIGSEVFTKECVDFLTPGCENLTARLLNPRKIQIRSCCTTLVRVFCRKSLLPALTGAESEQAPGLYFLTQERESVNVLDLRENGLTLSEDVSFDAAAPSAQELLFSRLQLCVQDCRAGAGQAQIRGSARIFCLFQSGKEGEKAELLPMEFTVPFAQTVKSKGLHEGGDCFCRLYPEGWQCRLRQDEFGQKRVVEFDATYACDLAVFYPGRTTVVLDAFSTENETESAEEEKTLCRCAAALRGSFSVGETVQLDLPDEGGYTVTAAFAEPELHAEAPGPDGRLVLAGSCPICLLLRDPAGAPDVRRTAVQLRLRTDVPAGEDPTLCLSAAVTGGRFRLDKKTLSCDFEVQYLGQMLEKRPERVLTQLNVLPEKRTKPGRRGSLLLAFPEEGESLFAVAKRYGVPPGSLSEPVRTGSQAGALLIPVK